MTDSKTFDLIVIGAGPGGYVAAIRAAQLQLKTAIVERDRLGGICLNWGCIPSKALLTNAKIYRQIKEAERWGITVGEIKVEMKKVIGRSREVADGLSKGVAYLMRKNNIEVFKGTARFRSKRELSILDEQGNEGERLKAGHVIIATGARARKIPGIEVEGKKIITYREALLLDEVPQSMIIIGAGAIGIEFAYFYSSFGCKVTVIEMMDQLLPLEDEEVGKELGRAFKKQAIDFFLQTKVTGAEIDSEGVLVQIEGKDGKKQEIRADLVLNAVGVVANVENMNLEKAGVPVEQNIIQVDPWYRANEDGIYAIGDVIGPPYLAHVASHEGIVCVEKIAGVETHQIDYNTIPSCTYCEPQVASVGMTEKKARQNGRKIKVGKFPFQALGKARASQSTDGFVKLIFDEELGDLLGAHIIGEEATEMVAQLVTAKALETTYQQLLKSVHAHPTLSEAIMEAAGAAYGEAIHI